MVKGFRIKGLASIMLAGVFCFCAAVPVLAAGTVRSLNLRFEDQYELGVIVEPEITCVSAGISIDSVTWEKDTDQWKPGKKVTAVIEVSSDGGREFLSSYGAESCKSSGARLTSAKGDGDTAIIKASYYPVVQLDSPEEAGWSAENPQKAVWKKADHATAYGIRLYRDGYLVRNITATGTSKDLSEYMTKEGSYYYEIRSMAKDDSDRKYMKSSEYLTSSGKLLDDMGDTEGRWRTYTDGKKYEGADGEVVKDQWYKIMNQWYYFDENGTAATGWRQIDGIWYRMDPEGVMLTGWQKVDGVWYYLNPDGSMAVGWIMDSPGQWYYLNSDGSMAADTVIDGCRLDPSGLWVE